jgi:peptide/nickel transport system substrate-binding protein
MKRAYRLVGVLCAAALVLAACGGSDGPGEASGAKRFASGGTFTVSVPSDPGNLDPLMTVLQATRFVDQFLYDRLLYSKEDGTFVSGLATKWEPTPTGATFTLAKGVTCADGSPLSASDVAGTFNFIADPKNQSPLLGVFVAPGTKATADDAAGTVTLTLPKPDPFLLYNTSLVFVVCGKGLTDPDGRKRGQHGSGAFTLTESVANDRYTLAKRPEYAWGPGGAAAREQGVPDKAIVRVIASETTATNLLLSGEITAATSVIGPDRKRLDGQDLFKLETRYGLGEMFFNQAPGHPAQDERVRRALMMALDLGELGRVMTDGAGLPAQGLVTAEPKPCSGDTVQGNLPAHDAAQAGTLLDQAGWTKGGDGVRVKDGKRLKLTVIFGSSLGDAVNAGMELLAQQWRQLGVEPDLKPISATQLNEILFSSGAWDAGLVQLTVQVPSQLVPFMSGAKPPKGTNFAHIDNPEYGRLVGEATRLSGAESCAQWNAAESALFKRLDVVRFVDSTIPTFAKGAEFDASLRTLIPVTVRMHAP